jgi:ornithine cyclodeaminase/alanine dehydrogenase-like protein (mu-crystallin family)
MLILNHEEVARLLDVDRLIKALEPAMVALSKGQVSMPPRTVTRVTGSDGLLASMPVFVDSPRILLAKLVSVFPENPKRGLPSHQAVIAVFETETGALRALLDGACITAARTAAGSALATKWLAREHALVLLIVGTGVQARSHFQAVTRVRDFREIRIAGRDIHRAGALAKELGAATSARVIPMELSATAFAGADVVCAATHASEPVVKGPWLTPGMHVNSVGLNFRGREVDADAVMKSVVFVELRAAALAPPPSGANDLTWPLRDGLIAPEQLCAEMGEVISGNKRGRTSPDQITLYKSVGVAVQDAVAAELVLNAALRQGIGKEVSV